MSKVTLIELFSGIGAQERALRQLGISYEVVNTCDCDANAILSYAAMRYDLEDEIATYDFPSVNTMIAELQAKNIGYDFKKHKHTITKRTPLNKLKRYYIADRLGKNLGDISKIDRLPYAEIVTYSFPCQDISTAGKTKGMMCKCNACGHSYKMGFGTEMSTCPQCGSSDVVCDTRSGLLGEVQRLLTVAHKDGALPRYLVLENVKNLIGKKFKAQFDAWIKWLDSIGYITYYKVLDSKDYGIPQRRERVFAVSIRKDIETVVDEFKFPQPVPLTLRPYDMLERDVDSSYYLPDERLLEIKELLVGVTEPIIVASRGRNPDNPSDRTVGIPTAQRLEPNFKGYTNTLSTVLKDNYVCEPVIIECAPSMRLRAFTPREYFRLMGFTDDDFDRAAKFNSKCTLYKQAANSIVTNCLIALFSSIFIENGYLSDVWTKHSIHTPKNS